MYRVGLVTYLFGMGIVRARVNSVTLPSAIFLLPFVGPGFLQDRSGTLPSHSCGLLTAEDFQNVGRAWGRCDALAFVPAHSQMQPENCGWRYDSGVQ